MSRAGSSRRFDRQRTLANRLLAAGLLAALTTAAGAAPQGPAAEPLAGAVFGEEVSVGMVLVPVLVQSRDGYVTGLEQGDFRLEVDGRPVAVEAFERRSDAAVSLVFLQDLSGSMASGGKLAASREAVLYFVDQARTGDEFALASFAGGATHVDVPFTGDLTALGEALDSWEAYGTTALHDAVAWIPEISTDGRAGKRGAVLLTDGVDNASTIPADQAREVVRRSQVPVYVLGLGSGSPYALTDEGAKLHRYADLLNLLARYTAGRYFPVSDPAELKEAVVTIDEQLRNQYVLGFAPSGSGEASHHRIRVTVSDPRLKVLARQGYYGTAPR